PGAARREPAADADRPRRRRLFRGGVDAGVGLRRARGAAGAGAVGERRAARAPRLAPLSAGAPDAAGPGQGVSPVGRELQTRNRLTLRVLLASSVTLVTAGRARRRGEPARHVRWLWGTAALGALFLAVQGYEWIRLIGFGLTLASGVYGTTFFALIGLHGLHVLAALVWLLVTTALVARG